MRVKRYLVDTLPDAVQLIRNELGKDAVILETKEIKVGGFMGMFRTKKIEVLAAVEPNKKTEADKKKLEKSEVDLVLEQILKASQKGKGEQTNDRAMADPAVNFSAQATKKLDAPPVPESVPNFLSQTYNNSNYNIQPKNEQIVREVNAVQKVQLEPEPNILNPSTHKDMENDQLFKVEERMSQTEQFILSELKNLRREMKGFNKKNEDSNGESENISILRATLQQQELNEEWINTLCEMLIEHEVNEQRELQLEEVWTFAKQQFLDWLLPFSKSTIENTTKVIQFVGPTGVGKTTTIAKLAAKYTIESNRKVGFITADTYRIAAVDQLKTYANILNLPFQVVFSPADLPKAYKELENCELIIMDTAGRNFKSDLYVSEVNSLIDNTQFSEGVLVVSLTSRTRDIAIVAEKFSKYGVRKVVFTKLDEANAYGSIFNMIMQFGLQPLFITSGQNVPDDIEKFTIENYVNLLLGEPKYE